MKIYKFACDDCGSMRRIKSLTWVKGRLLCWKCKPKLWIHSPFEELIDRIFDFFVSAETPEYYRDQIKDHFLFYSNERRFKENGK